MIVENYNRVRYDIYYMYSYVIFIGVFCRFFYSIVQKVVYNGKKCLLCVFNEDGEIIYEEFKMVSCKVVVVLYRSITEMYLFFRCDTINSEVFFQVSQDLKGVLVFIFFKENNLVGKVLILLIIGWLLIGDQCI